MAEKKPTYTEGVGWRYEKGNTPQKCIRLHGHRYNDVGTYLVTIVVAGRKPVFGYVAGNIKARRKSAADYPATKLTPLGEMVLYKEVPKIHALYPMVEVRKPVCIMPDHIHLIIRINSLLPPKKHLGIIVGAFKGGISRAWGGGTLFEKGYNDRILMNDGQLQSWHSYLRDNPFRWLVRHECPHLMRRSLCIVIAGTRYGAFGNFMLLRHPEKVQVFFHRRMEEKGQRMATEQTSFWQKEHSRLMEAAEQGNVMVTPGISECEKRIKNECLQKRYPLIHIQDKAIEQYWKPEKSRFEACMAGTLLILAPWQEDQKGESKHARFHDLNKLTAAICSLDADVLMKLALG